MTMGFTLNTIVPWGRSFGEYVAMFSLSQADLMKDILGSGDGPASFNAELSRQQGSVVSVDPLYQYSAQEIRGRIGDSFAEVMEQTRRNRHEFCWTTITSPEELGRLRMAAMETFLADYEKGRQAGRYLVGELPVLPFSDRQFELALCSHLLFLYSQELSEQFHLDAIRELVRVAGEVRIFPLLELGSKNSRHLQGVTAALAKEGYVVKIAPVPYEFQRRGNRMMQVRAA